jgi:hypothetical protein
MKMTKEEAQNLSLKIKTLKNSSQELYVEYGESAL